MSPPRFLLRYAQTELLLSSHEFFMAIYRCAQCGSIRETNTPANTKSACESCNAAVTVYDTVYFVDAMLKRLAAVSRELKALQQAPANAVAASAASSMPSVATSAALAAPKPRKPNTTASSPSLPSWFAERQIEVQFDAADSDTSGFFDDAALKLGNNFQLFGELIDRVRFAYRKSHNGITLELGQLAQKDMQAINSLCRELYEHTFFSRYFYQKQDKVVRLGLQPAPAVRRFFEGGWLEWFALMSVQQQAGTQTMAHARSVKVVFPNEDLHELDVMCLPAGQQPICIECKSSEFRRDIDKYMRLRKRLGIDRSRFVICATDLSAEQAAGLSAMYELSFVNLDMLKPHLQKLLTS